MKIAKITGVNLNPQVNNQKISEKKMSSPITSEQAVMAYRDFSINFRGRTPENFYEQEYNVKNMPSEMKKYLNIDYETRKHIPPEQVMGEVFKFISIADNVEDVKSLYPDEIYFSDLHEASLKGRSGILSDIKLAMDLEKSTLLKDSKEDFGVYLLRKIYQEGKTIREINKDFYEKDINPIYKGIVTQPITYGTTSAYGIRYPKTDFWNSFIATRDEYKKFFLENLPKDETVRKLSNQKSSGEKTSSNIKTEKTLEEKAPVRKYKIKDYKKKQLKDDIKTAKGSKEEIEKVVLKRFKKDDPEASFIVKYLSPIMTIAADRIHLSEEEKDFIEMEKIRGKFSDDKYTFSRFWKANPHLLDYYSTTIVDTMDMFEERYASGGLIPINKYYQAITDKTENQKAIDYVSKDFLDLLDYTQTIVPNRNAKYEAYNLMQEEWNKHFLERYGEVEEKIEQSIEKQNPEKMLQEIAKSHNAEVIKLKGKDGNEITITGNIKEGFEEILLKEELYGFPKKYARFFIRQIQKNPLCTQEYILSKALTAIRDKLADGQILSEEKMNEIEVKLLEDFDSEYKDYLLAAQFAMIEIFGKENDAGFLYRHYRGMRDEQTELALFKAFSKNYTLTEQEQMDRYYKEYLTPLCVSEANKIGSILTDYIANYNPQDSQKETSILKDFDTIQTFIEEFQKMCIKDKDGRKAVKRFLASAVQNIPITRCLLFTHRFLDENLKNSLKQAKSEVTMLEIINALYEKNYKVFQGIMGKNRSTMIELLTRVRMH